MSGEQTLQQDFETLGVWKVTSTSNNCTYYSILVEALATIVNVCKHIAVLCVLSLDCVNNLIMYLFKKNNCSCLNINLLIFILFIYFMLVYLS